ncbi:MAG TPA: hypothetical protein VH186_13010 [Chloroflexia bacterium]|nr:hypothetical protein [Chloroflexia bacterium]
MPERKTSSSDENVVAGNYFHVILAGLQGGGRYLTGLREYIGDRGYVVSSLSTRAGLKKGHYCLKSYYTSLAKQIVQKARGALIRIYAHSLGGIEALDLIRALAARTDLPHKTLELFLISPPGIGQKGLSGVGRVGLRFPKLIKNVGLYDQYEVFPLAGQAAEQLEQNELILLKHQRFLNEWLPRLIPDQKARNKIIEDVQFIDRELLLLREHPELRRQFEKWYLSQRHKIMRDLLNRIFSGKHIKEEKHQLYLSRYTEQKEHLAPKWAYLWCLTTLLGKLLKTLYQGLDYKVLELVEFCRAQGVEARLGTVILGKDELVKLQDYAHLNELCTQHSIPLYQHIFENEEHASVAHKWELIDALESLNCSNAQEIEPIPEQPYKLLSA